MRQNIAFVVNSHNSCTHFILACDDVVFIVTCGWSLCVSEQFFFSVTSVPLLWKRFHSLLFLHKTIWSIFLEKHIFGLSRICELYWRQYEQPVGKSINTQVVYSSTKHRAIYKDEWILCRALMLVVRFHTFKSDPICICLHQKDGFGQMNWIQNYCLGCVTTGYTMTTLNFIHSLLQNIDSIAKNVRPYVFIFECWILYAYCATYFIHFSMGLQSNIKPGSRWYCPLHGGGVTLGTHMNAKHRKQ